MTTSTSESIENAVKSFGRVISKNITQARIARGMSQRDFADMLGMGRSSYNHIEQNRRRVKLDESVILCRVLEVPLEYLLYGGNSQVARLLSEAADLRARAALLEKQANSCGDTKSIKDSI